MAGAKPRTQATFRGICKSQCGLCPPHPSDGQCSKDGAVPEKTDGTYLQCLSHSRLIGYLLESLGLLSVAVEG